MRCGYFLFCGYTRPLPLSKGTSSIVLLFALINLSVFCLDGHHAHNKDEEASMHWSILSQSMMYQNYRNCNSLGVMMDSKANHSVADYLSNCPVQVDWQN